MIFAKTRNSHKSDKDYNEKMKKRITNFTSSSLSFTSKSNTFLTIYILTYIISDDLQLISIMFNNYSYKFQYFPNDLHIDLYTFQYCSNKYQQIATNINKYQQISSNINKYQQISTNINKYRQISIHINKSIQI